MPYSYKVFVDSTGVGHTFIAIYGPDGQSETWGYYPAKDNEPLWPGELRRDDVDRLTGLPKMHPYDWSTDQIQITGDQYNAFKTYAQWVHDHPGTYGALENNCTEFVEDMLNKGVGRPKVSGNHGDTAGTTRSD